MTDYERAVAALGPGLCAYARCTLVDLAAREPDRVWYVARATKEEDPWLPRYETVLGDELYQREGYYYDQCGQRIPLPRYRLDFMRLTPPDAGPVQRDLFGRT